MFGKEQHIKVIRDPSGNVVRLEKTGYAERDNSLDKAIKDFKKKEREETIGKWKRKGKKAYGKLSKTSSGVSGWIDRNINPDMLSMDSDFGFDTDMGFDFDFGGPSRKRRRKRRK